MNRLMTATIALAVWGLGSMSVYGSQAGTSAAATGGWGRRPGTASATAQYEGDLGLARTHSQSGQLNYSRGVAVGYDEDGLSVSVSHAIAPNGGPAVAGTFNLSVDSDGHVDSAIGRVVAQGGARQQVQAGGIVGTGPRAAAPTAIASGRTWGGGSVQASTRVDSGREHVRGYGYGERRVVPHERIARPVR